MMRFLESQGFELVRVRGSHHVFERGTQRTVVAVHGSETLKIGTLRAILRDVELSPARFAELWER
jgi:predicted RNA binding protein YcfA (HicA-like mRNA interferase family)